MRSTKKAMLFCATAITDTGVMAIGVVAGGVAGAATATTIAVLVINKTTFYN